MEIQNHSWHAVSGEEALKALETSEDGLSEEACAKRLEQFGPNKLPERKRAGLFLVFLRQFKNPLIYILLIAGGVSVGISAMSDAMFIFAVLVITSVIGTVQEWKAESSAEALKSVMRVMARVRRNGQRQRVGATQVVPGDIVLLESGASIPADIRLISTQNLRVDESLAEESAKPPLVIRLEQLTRAIALVVLAGVVVEIEPVSFQTWGILLGLALTLILVMELYKQIRVGSLTRLPTFQQDRQAGGAGP